MDIKQALGRVVERIDLTSAEMQDVMQAIMSGQCSDAQIAALLVALRMKSESIDEIEGAARVMRDLASRVTLASQDYVVDIVGTGGDGANLFNVSTASAMVVAAAGAKVAKHGNRAVSSKSGSADLLEAAGINLALSSEQVARCIDSVGVGFLFAVNHHGAMKHAIAARREVGLRTLFNLLGPLTNPAFVTRQVVGVFNPALCRPMAEVLGRLGSVHALVVCAKDGLDEVSLATATHVAELKNGEVREFVITPEELGVTSQSLVGLSVADSAESLALIKNALGKRATNESVKAADIIKLNAGAAIYVAGITQTWKQGVALADDLMCSGQALEKLNDLRLFTRALLPENSA
ncbi:MAG: anthranilate phosphoribosyltransferase [Moraxellaceae bacterium]|nr:anthranilate phosphoribosyltransferase [Moraxellaceae bacterium]